MQFHLNGFRPGDPAIAPEVDTDAGRDRVDVLIVGCGPAGLTLAAQLAQFPDISTRIVERKTGPLEVGQADGIACRTMEMFAAFGFADEVAREAYWVNEVAFWRPGASGQGIARADRIRDVEEDLSEMPHVILNQARVHDHLLRIMRNGPRRLTPDYDYQIVELNRDDDPDHPCIAHMTVRPDQTRVTIRARYVVGCDGARSSVRAALGHDLKGDSARQLWGVMDVLAVTDFPDIRLKCAIQSEDAGSLLIIPREGGYMVRLYVELAELADDERAADRDVTPDMLIEKARAVLSPYSLEVREVAWWSAYEIGQRVCDAFDDVPPRKRGQMIPRIFIAGDACHTHSPKAGQGMNVSMADTFNLGWKLAAVLRGHADAKLLDTYSGERRATAQELIDFDRDMARLFSEKPKTPAEAADFQKYFQKHGRYTAGVETRYGPSMIVGNDTHQALATGFRVGMRFHSAPVIRLADAKPMQLGHILKADGRWRLIAFAPTGDTGEHDGPIARLCSQLANSPQGALLTALRAGGDPEEDVDLRAVFQCHHRDLSPMDLPTLLRPPRGKYGLTDYEKAFCPDLENGPDIFDLRGIDRARGALIVVRPDQIVAHVLPLEPPYL